MFMVPQTTHVAILTAAVESRHHCRAIHLETVPVTDLCDGKIIWKGNVEVFYLSEHAETKRCFAWDETSGHFKHQFVAILQKGPVVSPETAVKAWLASRTVTIHPVVKDNETELTVETRPWESCQKLIEVEKLCGRTGARLQ